MAMVFDFSDGDAPKKSAGPPKGFGQKRPPKEKKEEVKVTGKPPDVPAKKKWVPQIADDVSFDDKDPFGPGKVSLVNDEAAGFGGSGAKPKMAMDDPPPKAETKSPKPGPKAAPPLDESDPFGASAKPKMAMDDAPKSARKAPPPPAAKDPFLDEGDPFGSKKAPKMGMDPDDPFAQSSKPKMAMDDEPPKKAAAKPKVANSPAPGAPKAAAQPAAPTEFPDGGGGAAPVATGPLSSRSVDKLWSTRAAAYEELAGEFNKGESSIFDEYTGKQLAGYCSDANAPALEKALEAVSTFCEKAPNAGAVAEEVVPALLGKPFGGGKASAIGKAQDICFFLIQAGSAKMVVELLQPGCTDKNVKVVVATTNTLERALHEFGPQQVNIQTVQKPIPTIFENPKPEARKAAADLCNEIYRWMGPLFQQWLEKQNVKPTTLKELSEAFASIPQGEARPQRYLRGQSAPAPGTESKQAAFDPMSLLQAVDVCEKLSKNWVEGTKEEKWDTRKEKLDELVEVCEANPKAKVGARTDEVAGCLKRLCNDVNVNVVAAAVKAYMALAKGARKEFAPYAKAVVPVMLAALKEKKITVTKPVNECLDAFYEYCLKLTDCWEAIAAAMDDKVPKVRTDAASWLVRCLQNPLSNGGGNGAAQAAKDIAPCLLKALGDQDGGVRKAVQECFVEIVATCGVKVLKDAGVLPKLEADAKRWKAIQDAAAQNNRSGDGAASGGGEEEEAPKRAAKEETKAPAAKATPKPAAKPAAEPAGPPARSAPPAATPAASKPAAGGKVGLKVKDEKFVPSGAMEYEEAKGICDTAFGASIEKAADKKWQDSVAGLEECTAKVEGDGKNAEEYTRALFYYLRKTPTFSPTNFNVCKKVYALLEAIAKANPEGITKTLANLPLADMLSKFADKKISGNASSAIFAFCICPQVGPQFMLSQIYAALKEITAVKAQEGAVEMVAQMIEDFGIGSFDARNTIAMVKEWYESQSGAVRANATKVFVGIYKQTGNALKDMMLADLKSSLVTEIQKQFDAIPPEEVGKSTAKLAVVGQEVAAEVNMDDVIPRTDISAKITDKLLSNLNHDNWQTRQEALGEVVSILASANHRVAANVGGLPGALKDRLGDTNKNLIKTACDVIKMLADDMGDGVKPHVSKLVPGICGAMTSNEKAHIKSSAAAALSALMANGGCSSAFKPIGAVLAKEAVREATLEAAREMVSQEVAAGKTQDAWSDLGPALIDCLQDKNNKVRAHAEGLLEFQVQQEGFDFVKKSTDRLSKAALLALGPTLKKLRETKSAVPCEPDEADEKKDDKKKPAAGKAPPPPAKKEETKAKPAAATKAGATTTAAKKKDEVPEDISMTACSDKEKQRRLLKESKQKIPLEEQIDELKTELAKYVPPGIYASLFHVNLPEQLKGLAAFETLMTDNYADFETILDLVLKWAAWKISVDANTKVVAAVNDFFNKLLPCLEEKQYQVHDSEAGIILPAIIEKEFGHNTARFRTDSRAIVVRFATVYPATKICAFLVAGFKSNNKKVTADCLEEVGDMVTREGIQVFDPVTVMPVVGKLVGSSTDQGIRKGALHCIGELYKIVNEDVYKYVQTKKAPLDQKSLDMIAERLRMIRKQDGGDAKAAPAKAAAIKTEAKSTGVRATPATTAAAARSSPSSRATTPASRSPGPGARTGGTTAAASKPAASAAAASIDDLPDMFRLDLDALGLGSETLGVGDNDLLDLGGYAAPPISPKPAVQRCGVDENLLAKLNPSIPEEERIEAMGSIWQQITKSGNGIVKPEADRIALLLIGQVNDGFDKAPGEEIAYRLCKYAVQLLREIWSEPTVPATVHLTTVEKLQRALITHLMDPRIQAKDGGDKEKGHALYNNLSTLEIAVIDMTDRTISFHILLKLLNLEVANPNAPPGFVDMTTRCLVKLLKKLTEPGPALNLPLLLTNCHDFFEHHPVSSFAPGQDVPLRVVRTTLAELVKASKPAELQNALRSFPPACFLRHEVERFTASAGEQGPAPPGGATGGMTPATADPILEKIFERLHAKDTTATALKELYDFTVAYPDISIQSHLDKCRTVFQGYIVRGLQRQAGGQASAPPPSPTASAPAAASTDTAAYRERLSALRQKTSEVAAGNTTAPAPLSMPVAAEPQKRAPPPPAETTSSRVAAAPPPAPASSSATGESAAERMAALKARIAKMRDQSV